MAYPASPSSPHAEIVIDLGAVRHNVSRLRELVSTEGRSPALMVVVKGSADVYTIQWAERAPSPAEKPAIDDAKWQDRLSKLKPIRFCPIVPGEAMPYPSCVGRNFQKLPSQKT